MKSFEYITEVAKSTHKLNNRDTALFHYFNPLGLYPQLKAAEEAVAEVVEKGNVPNGVLLVHGGFGHDLLVKELWAMSEAKRVNSSKLAVWEFSMARAINDANAWVRNHNV